MNINRATLFPGLDGFSASLGSLNVVPEAVVSDGLIVGDEYSSQPASSPDAKSRGGFS